MTSWFRSWHGAPTDMKWRTIAKRAGVPSGYVTAIVWTLLDRASQADERGSIAGYDAEEIAVALDFDPDQVEAVIAAMRDKGVLDGDTFTGWAKHQPGREDGSAERAKAWRERKRAENQQVSEDRTQANAGERTKTPREDTDTDIPPENTTCSLPPKGEDKRTPGRALPSDWQPKEKHFELGRVLGFSDQAIRDASDAMRDWADANRNRAVGRKADWDKTFNNWLRNNVPKSHSARDGPQSRGSLTDAAIDFQHETRRPRHEPETRTIPLLARSG